jgi:hypothetical protein
MRLPILLGLLLAGCATPIDTYQRLQSLDTPTSWSPGNVWRFKISAGKSSSGELTLRLTNQKAENGCDGGDWFRAEAVSSTLSYP